MVRKQQSTDKIVSALEEFVFLVGPVGLEPTTNGL